MAVYLAESKILYTAAPGTGSTSLESFFLANGGVKVPEEDVLSPQGFQLLDSKHATFAEILKHEVLSKQQVKTVVTSIRNPFDYWHAEWHRNRTKWLRELKRPKSWIYKQPNKINMIIESVEKDFQDWIVDRLAPQRNRGQQHELHGAYTQEADVCIRMEHMLDEVRELKERLGADLDLAKLNYLNKTAGEKEPYWKYYGVEGRALVEYCFAPTLERFGYAF